MPAFWNERGGWRSAAADWLAGAVGIRRRHVRERRGRRVYVELRELAPEEFDRFAEELGESLERLEGIEGYAINGPLRMAVVGYRSALRDPEEIVAVVEGVEAYCDLDDRPFPDRYRRLPGTIGQEYRRWAEFGADLIGACLGVGLKLVRGSASAAQFDTAAFLSIVEEAPKLRERFERIAGPDAFELIVGLVNAFVQAVGSGPVGPIVDALHQVALIRSVAARRRVWDRLESTLAPGMERSVVAIDPEVSRPGSMPEGPIERYADEAWFASVGGFVVALADTHRLESSTAPLFGGLPKAARYARDGYTSELIRALSERDVLVLDPAALEVMDRVDTLVIEGGYYEERLPEFELLAREARRAGLELVVTGIAPVEARRYRARAVGDGGGDPVDEIRSLQKQGACVAVVGCGASPAYRAADISFGTVDVHGEVPWRADLVSSGDVEDALFWVESVVRSRRVSEQGVFLAGLGATLGTFLSLRGLRETDPETVKLAVNAVSIVSLANGMVRAIELERSERPEPRDPTPWHARPIEAVLEEIETTRDGLASSQVAARYRPPAPEPSTWVQARRAILEELSNPMTPVLGAAAAASAAVGSLTDAALVSAVVAVNSCIGGIERFRSERAVRRLRRSESREVRVRRKDGLVSVAAGEVVRGDVVEFEAGDVVPFDCRLLEADHLEVDESALTGESLPVRKSAEPVEASAVADRTSMLYDGTSIANGSATAVVVAVGERTEARWSGVGETGRPLSTGLESRLASLADLTMPVAGSAGALVATLGLLREQEFRQLADTGLGLAVAAVPEGLPLLATVAELAAARRLSESDVLVRNPRALEALGRVDVLCADKTGTLTVGRIRLGAVSDGRRRASIGSDRGRVPAELREVVGLALRASPRPSERGEFAHPTDRAVVEGSRDLDVEPAWSHLEYEPLDDLQFTPQRGYYASLGRVDARYHVAVKGAPEVVLERCDRLRAEGPLEPARREELRERAEALASEGLRVLCVAERELEPVERLDDGCVQGLRFRGFVGLQDPARSTAPEALRKLRSAGIQTLMMTGDHPRTADAIARDVGLERRSAILSGSEIEAMTDDELAEVLPTTPVIARVTPAQKSRIVRILQEKGRVVAMTGDGANDAAAIRRAEVGLALGRRATDAAREAADILVLDEKIETIVRCVAEGRAMLEAVRDSVSILVGGNFGEIGFTLLASLFGNEPPLNARQLLLVNLLTDIAPSMSIALRTPEEAHLARLLEGPPRELMTGELQRAMGVRAAATAGGATLAWVGTRMLPFGRSRASTAALSALIQTQLAQTLLLGDPSSETIWATGGSMAALLGAVAVPGVHRLFGCRLLGPLSFGISTGAALSATGVAVAASHLSAVEDRRAEAEDDGRTEEQ